MKFKLIVAYCKNYGIGKNNKLPWHIKTDLIKFSKLTQGSGNNAIVMGKNTWLSIPKKPLKNRDNLILSTSIKLNNKEEKIRSFTNIKDLQKFCNIKQYDTVWIIGGYSIYKEFFDKDLIDEIYITYIDTEYDCDTFYPIMHNNSKWKLIENSIHINIDCNFNIYDQIYIKN